MASADFIPFSHQLSSHQRCSENTIRTISDRGFSTDRPSCVNCPATTSDDDVLTGNEDADGDDEVFDISPANALSNENSQYDELSLTLSAHQIDDKAESDDCRNAECGPTELLHPTISVERNQSQDLPRNSTLTRRHGEDPDVNVPEITINNMDQSSESGGKIGLLVRLVRTHPIWFLPHFGRVAAMHLLRGKSTGAFIVRHSRLPDMMAITIKLPPEADQDMEHYLIQKTIAGVRLEGSQNYFKALPLLLAYYCENGEELHTKLALPPAIMECNTCRELDSLALLGQDFWTSDECTKDKVAGPSTDASTIERCSRALPSSSSSLGIPANDLAADKLTKKLKQTKVIPDIPGANRAPALISSHRRSASLSAYPTSSRSNGASCRTTSPFAAAILQHVGGVFRRPSSPRSSDKNGSSATSKLQKTARERLFPSKLRSESVSVAGQECQRQQSCDSTASSQLSNQERRSFRLRNIFDRRFSQGSGSPPSPRTTDEKAKTLENKKSSVALDQVLQVRRPAPPPPPKLPPKRRSSSKGSDQWVSSEKNHEYYYFSPAVSAQVENGPLSECKSVNSLLQEAIFEEQAVDTPTLERRRLLTFKPSSPCEKDEPAEQSHAIKTKCDSLQTLVIASKQVEELQKFSPLNERHSPVVLSPKPGVLRREKSDLGWVSIGGISSSRHEHPSHAVLPPKNKDPAFRSCVEELRRRRFESLRHQMAVNLASQPATTVLHSRKDGSPHIVATPMSSNTLSAVGNSSSLKNNVRLPPSPVSVLMRQKPMSQSNSGSDHTSHRLSAPNLAELDNRGGIEQLRIRQANTGNSGLHTINEGLVTPMASRRLFKVERQPERRLSQSLEDLPNVTDDFLDVASFMPRKFASERGAKTTSKVAEKKETKQRHESLSAVQGNTRRNEKAFHDETNFQWLAVSKEVRTKQKVAKVAPTRSPFVPPPVQLMSSNDQGRYSDYVVLNECGEIVEDSQQIENEYGNRYGSIGVSISDNRESHGQDADFDDARSVVSAAGTVFNEPWDSSVWENLLTLASSMDKSRPETDSRGSCITNSNSSSNRPSQTEIAESVSSLIDEKPPTLVAEISKQRTTEKIAMFSRQTNVNFGERLKKLKENNIPPSIAPDWEEFSSLIPLSSDSSLPTSTPTNSLEGKRKSYLSSIAGNENVRNGQTTKNGDCPLDDDHFQLSLISSPIRFRTKVTNTTNVRGRQRRRAADDPSVKIQECVERLADDYTTFFGKQVQSFISCTLEGHETDPLVTLGYVRQFMNGVKNYLVKNGERDLHQLIEQERSRLRLNEFLNIDAILEGVLQKIILAPLKPHLYHLLVKESSSSGSLEILSENLALIRNKSPSEIGMSSEFCDAITMEQVRNNLRKMQHHYSPLKKLEYLLHAVSLSYNSDTNGRVNGANWRSKNRLPTADELLRWFVFLLSRCSMVGCEVESTYMWHLLHPALLAGEASYYLTAFSSAVHVLKHVDLLPRLRDPDALSSSQVGESSEGFIKVAVPDEVNGAINYHNFPAMPQLTVSRLCRMIARKCGITNPEDHGLYLLVDGYETCLLASECPELVKEQLRSLKKPHLFAYKRHEAKIAWPKVAMSPRL